MDTLQVSGSLRNYQNRCITETLEAWPSNRRICLVLPTGGGKTVVGQELCRLAQAPHTLWIAHRNELINQAAERLRQAFGPLNVGVIAAGVAPQPYAPIQVASIQTLIARDHRPPAELLVFDECHHIKAKTYQAVADHYSDARQLGLTATPERRDGSALGDMFDHLVVGAQYSELISQGHLVDCRVLQPPEIPGSTGLALSPLAAYQRYAPGTRAFGFAQSVELAERYAAEFTQAGIPSTYADATTPAAERAARLEAFRSGAVQVLWNVFLFTEGTDVPEAETIILSRGCSHVSLYLQIVGRALRPHSSKQQATLIDLSGASLIHGMPTEDRIYSLDGDGIKRTSLAPLKVCQQCGTTILSAYQVCPSCGYEFPRRPGTDPKIFDWALKEVFAGDKTPDDAKQREWERLRKLCKLRDWGISFAIKEFRKLFGPNAALGPISDDEWRDEYRRLKSFGAARGYKPGFAKVRFKELSGRWPNGGW